MSAVTRLVIVACTLAGCTSSNPLYICGDDCPGDLAAVSHDLAGADFAGRDLATPPSANPDLSTPSGPVDLAAPIDLQKSNSDLARICSSAGTGTCFGQGPSCPGAGGNGCCGQGEWCDHGTCRCADGPACTGADRCSAGLVQFNACGTLCCGGFNDPCPL